MAGGSLADLELGYGTRMERICSATITLSGRRQLS